MNGFGSGYQGEGPKTIIPSKATAKLSFRLVPDQDPYELRPVVEEFLKRQCPDSVEMEIVRQHSGKAYLVKPDSAFGKAAQKALADTFGQASRFYSGGRERSHHPIVQGYPRYRYSAAGIGIAGLQGPFTERKLRD